MEFVLQKYDLFMNYTNNPRKDFENRKNLCIFAPKIIT